ncbi:hypothetical protein ACFYTV_33470 [Streptomyces sp. NPDC004562]|uniref:hypothetical protein n=1 Tax=Streptomyces sp. NPDC004562 TaxID=3364703 RepID=UPI003686E989
MGDLQGSPAPFAAVDARLPPHKPARLSTRVTAALPWAVITAWEGLVDRAGVRAGQKVLVHGGAGDVDSVAVRIAAARGAELSATASAARTPLVRRLQAVPIDYTPVPVERYVAEHPGGTGFNIVFDTVGGPALASSFEAVRTCTGHAVSAPGRGHPRIRAAVVPGSPLLGRAQTAADTDGPGPPTPRRGPERNRQPGGRGRTASRYTRADVTDSHRAAVENAAADGKVVIDVEP